LEAKSEHIKTLKEGPLAEVKRHNLPTLQYMAKSVKEMIKKLLAMDKLVLLLIPLYGSQRREVFDQWQAVLKETMEDLPFPSFRMLNLQSLM
jgi:exopolyphosphatase/pppGpp-phosphohydrolase